MHIEDVPTHHLRLSVSHVPLSQVCNALLLGAAELTFLRLGASSMVQVLARPAGSAPKNIEISIGIIESFANLLCKPNFLIHHIIILAILNFLTQSNVVQNLFKI